MWWSSRRIHRSHGWQTALVLTLVLAVLTGCGYQHPSAAIGKSDTQGIHLFAGLWKNQTNQMGLEADLHRDLIAWLQRNSDITITAGTNQADFQLEGEILEINHPGQTYSTFTEAKELVVSLAVSYRLIDREDGAVLWQEPRIIRSEIYPIGDDAIRTRDNRAQALGRISDDLAEEIYLKILGYRRHDRSP